MSGALVLVVGPSGAGKDTLLAAARAELAGDGRFGFVRRVVTRHAVAALEDHESIDAPTFAANERAGAYALSWEAHGLCYGLPAEIDAAIAAGRVMVANGSRQAVRRALDKYPDCRVLLVDAAPDVRAARLAARGREDAGTVAARLARAVDALPEAARVTVIDNSGALAAGTSAFVAALRAIAAA